MMEKSLKDARLGERLLVKKLACGEGICDRFRDLGLVEGTIVECVGIAPLGDLIAFLICGAVIALRGTDTKNILVEEVG